MNCEAGSSEGRTDAGIARIDAELPTDSAVCIRAAELTPSSWALCGGWGGLSSRPRPATTSFSMSWDEHQAWR
jgi:hypothetical protein